MSDEIVGIGLGSFCANFVEDLGYSDKYQDNIEEKNYIKKLFCDKDEIEKAKKEWDNFQDFFDDFDINDYSFSDIIEVARTKSNLMKNFLEFLINRGVRTAICLYIKNTDFEKLLIDIEKKMGYSLKDTISKYKQKMNEYENYLDILDNVSEENFNVDDFEDNPKFNEFENAMEKLKLMVIKMLVELFGYYDLEGLKISFNMLTKKTRDDLMNIDIDDFMDSYLNVIDYFVMFNYVVLNDSGVYTDYIFHDEFTSEAKVEYEKIFQIYYETSKDNLLDFEQQSKGVLASFSEFYEYFKNWVKDTYSYTTNDSKIEFSEYISIVAEFKRVVMEFLNNYLNTSQYNLYSYIDFHLSKSILYTDDKELYYNTYSSEKYIHKEDVSDIFGSNSNKICLSEFMSFETINENNKLTGQEISWYKSYNLSLPTNNFYPAGQYSKFPINYWSNLNLTQKGYILWNVDINNGLYNSKNEENLILQDVIYFKSLEEINEEKNRQRDIVYSFLIDKFCDSCKYYGVKHYDKKTKTNVEMEAIKENLKENLKELKECIIIKKLSDCKTQGFDLLGNSLHMTNLNEKIGITCGCEDSGKPFLQNHENFEKTMNHVGSYYATTPNTDPHYGEIFNFPYRYKKFSSAVSYSNISQGEEFFSLLPFNKNLPIFSFRRVYDVVSKKNKISNISNSKYLPIVFDIETNFLFEKNFLVRIFKDNKEFDKIEGYRVYVGVQLLNCYIPPNSTGTICEDSVDVYRDYELNMSLEKNYKFNNLPFFYMLNKLGVDFNFTSESFYPLFKEAYPYFNTSKKIADFVVETNEIVAEVIYNTYQDIKNIAKNLYDKITNGL